VQAAATVAGSTAEAAEDSRAAAAAESKEQAGQEAGAVRQS
jgi:hypothetical protein